jgi:hypothetical protein
MRKMEQWRQTVGAGYNEMARNSRGLGRKPIEVCGRFEEMLRRPWGKGDVCVSSEGRER